MALSFSERFSLLFYDWVSDSRESYRRRKISPPPTIRRMRGNKEVGKRSSTLALSLSLAAGLSSRSGEARRRLRAVVPHEFHVSPSLVPRHPRPTISRTKQPPGQVPFKCLRNRRFCPSSDEHHCLSICLSVYRIDIREWQDRRPSPSFSFPRLSSVYLTLPSSHSLSLSFLSSSSAASPSSKMYFCAFMREARPSLVPLLFFVRCGGFPR